MTPEKSKQNPDEFMNNGGTGPHPFDNPSTSGKSVPDPPKMPDPPIEKK